MESRQLVLNLHEEWERNDITRYFQGLHYPGRPDSRRFPSSEDRDAWTTARFIMIHRGPSAGWFHEEREAAVHSPKDWRDVHLAGAVINFFNENILIQPGEAKSVAGKAVSMRKLKIFAMILRDLREEFKPDYEKRFPGWPSNDSGAFGGTEEERNAHRKMLEESRRKVEKAMVMRGWHASLAEVIRRGETSLCTGLRNNFSGNAVAIREILVCAGWKTPEQRADYWARMKKEGRSVQWSDADAAFLMPEPKESPPDTGH